MRRRGEGKQSSAGSDGPRRRPMVQSVERAGRILELLSTAGPQGKRVVELSKELGLHKTTVVRLLRTLMAVGPVKRDHRTGRYCWEPLSWIALVGGAREMIAQTDMVQAVLKDLADACGAIAVLARPDSYYRHVIFVAVAHPEDVQPQYYWYLGATWPTHATASGRVCLAGLSDSELEEWTERNPEAVTEPTISSWEKLGRELRRCRERGYAMRRGEYSPGIAAVAVPLRDEDKRVVGAVAISMPSVQVSSEKIPEWVALLNEAAGKLSQLLYGRLGLEADPQRKRIGA